MTPATLDPRRPAVVAEAHTWRGTRYHHRARIKGQGVDCAQILIAVYSTAAGVPEIDPGEYPTDWHFHRSEELYMHWLEQAGAVRVDEPLPGDIGLFKFGRTFSHGAIYVGNDEWVHAYHGQGVILSRTDEAPLHARPVQYWSVLETTPHVR